jgi:soluble cytochrome b562
LTRTEIERLAVVETKIDTIITDMATVKKDLKCSNEGMKEFITHEVGAQKEAVSIALTNAKEAVTKTENINNLKFEIANNVKADMGKEISNLKDEMTKKIDELKEYQSKQTGSKSGVKEFIGYILAAITIVGFIITQFINSRGGV